MASEGHAPNPTDAHWIALLSEREALVPPAPVPAADASPDAAAAELELTAWESELASAALRPARRRGSRVLEPVAMGALLAGVLLAFGPQRVDGEGVAGGGAQARSGEEVIVELGKGRAEPLALGRLAAASPGDAESRRGGDGANDSPAPDDPTPPPPGDGSGSDPPVTVTVPVIGTVTVPVPEPEVPDLPVTLPELPEMPQLPGDELP